MSTEFEGYLLYCCKVMVSAAYTHILAIINRMAAEINVNISKIMNWTLTNTNTKLEISFHTLNNHHYLAHKTVVAYYNMQTIVLNTSFKISYSHHDHIVHHPPNRFYAKSHTSTTKIIPSKSVKSRSISTHSWTERSSFCPSKTMTKCYR